MKKYMSFLAFLGTVDKESVVSGPGKHEDARWICLLMN